jgi:hypothetical protein
MNSLARVMATKSAIAVLRHLAILAIDLCGAGTGGVSVIEAEENGADFPLASLGR